VRLEGERQPLESGISAPQACRRAAGGTQGRRSGQRAGAQILAGADRGGLCTQFQIADSARRIAGAPGAGDGAGQEFLAAFGHPADGRRFSRRRRGPQKKPGIRDPLVEPGRLLPAPGFGYPGDDFRIEQARRLYSGGIAYANQVQCEIDWWIFWGRVAGGLNRNQQADVYQRLSGFLLPRGNKKPQRINLALLREMWRTAASLELLPLGAKTELGDALIKRIKVGDYKESELWCVSRLGARQLFYGPSTWRCRPPP